MPDKDFGAVVVKADSPIRTAADLAGKRIEPFAAVDAQTRADLEDLVRTLWRRLGMTILFVTHDIDESVYLGQRVLVLSHRPTVVLADVRVDLPDDRDQLGTRSSGQFTRIRGKVYELVQQAKKGVRPVHDQE